MKGRRFLLIPGPLDDGLAHERVSGCDLQSRSIESLEAEYRQIRTVLDCLILDREDAPIGCAHTQQSYCRARLTVLRAELRRLGRAS